MKYKTSKGISVFYSWTNKSCFFFFFFCVFSLDQVYFCQQQKLTHCASLFSRSYCDILAKSKYRNVIKADPSHGMRQISSTSLLSNVCFLVICKLVLVPVDSGGSLSFYSTDRQLLSKFFDR